MEIVKRLFHLLGKKEYVWLCLLVLVVLAMHFSIIAQPAEPIFDEQHYVPDARSILQGEGTLRGEHPPLGKLFIVFGMFLFGDNPLGWRFFSVLFGAICIVLFYLVCRQLAMSKRASFLATSLLALENLSFVQASVAMLDVYSVAFMLCSFWLYLKGRYLLSGVSVALAALAKIGGVLALPAILLHWLLTKRASPLRFVATMLTAYASFLLLMPLFDFFVFRKFVNPVARIATMLTTGGNLTFANYTHEAASRPWDWVLHPEMFAYWNAPYYIAAISPTIWALIIPSVLYMVFRAIKGNQAGLFGISWFASTYLVWIPLSLITDRISYLYYFYPTVGAICIGLGLGFSQLIAIWETGRYRKLKWATILAVSGYLLFHIIIFVNYSPIFT
jgi:dolichyl-phosphate-mannose-protein mannosyltransferase